MILPPPADQYDKSNEAQTRAAIASEDARNVKNTQYATTTVRGVVKVDGTTVTADTDGTLHASASGLGVPSYTEGTWTPTDASGAGLTLTIVRSVWRRINNMRFVQVILTYPVTANGNSAVIGGLPVAVPTNGNSVLSATSSSATGPDGIHLTSAGTIGALVKNTGPVTNANMSGANLIFSGWYPET